MMPHVDADPAGGEDPRRGAAGAVPDDEAEPTFQSLTEKDAQCAHCIPDGRPFPVALDPFT